MNETEFETYLSERYEGQRAYYDALALRMKRYYVVMQFVTVIGGALTPVLIALSDRISVPPGLDGKLLAIIVSSLVAVAVGLSTAFKIRDEWIRYRYAAETLERLKRRFDARLGAFEIEPVEARRQKFVDAVERLIATENNAWLETFSEEAPEDR